MKDITTKKYIKQYVSIGILPYVKIGSIAGILVSCSINQPLGMTNGFPMNSEKQETTHHASHIPEYESSFSRILQKLENIESLIKQETNGQSSELSRKTHTMDYIIRTGLIVVLAGSLYERYSSLLSFNKEPESEISVSHMSQIEICGPSDILKQYNYNGSTNIYNNHYVNDTRSCMQHGYSLTVLCNSAASALVRQSVLGSAAIVSGLSYFIKAWRLSCNGKSNKYITHLKNLYEQYNCTENEDKKEEIKKSINNNFELLLKKFAQVPLQKIPDQCKNDLIDISNIANSENILEMERIMNLKATLLAWGRTQV